MSNVRPRKRPHHEGAFVARRTARAIAQIAGLPQARHHRSAAPVAAWFLCHRRSSRPRPAFAEKVRRRLEARNEWHMPWHCGRPDTRSRFKSVLLGRAQAAAIPRISRSPKSARPFQASATRFALPVLVCFAIQMKTQIQGKVAAHGARPNPSFKRTCLRQSA